MVIIIKKKQIILSASFILIFGIICILYTCFFDSKASASTTINTNWGLSFKENGKAPTGNASSDFLKQYNAFFMDPKEPKTVYLTFDSGYENGCTEPILDALKKHNAKAAFFVVGNFVKTNPQIVKRITDEGHIVGNHTLTHPDMSKISKQEDFKKEIVSLENLYKEATGKDMQKFYRPPQGKYNEENLKQANALGYKTIFWSLAYVDWYTEKQPSSEEAFNKLLPRIHPGAIILLHSTSSTNAAILDELLSKIENMGYSFGTIDNLC